MTRYFEPFVVLKFTALEALCIKTHCESSNLCLLYLSSRFLNVCQFCFLFSREQWVSARDKSGISQGFLQWKTCGRTESIVTHVSTAFCNMYDTYDYVRNIHDCKPYLSLKNCEICDHYYSIFFSAKKRYRSTEAKVRRNKQRNVRRINTRSLRLEQHKEEAFALERKVMNLQQENVWLNQSLGRTKRSVSKATTIFPSSFINNYREKYGL